MNQQLQARPHPVLGEIGFAHINPSDWQTIFAKLPQEPPKGVGDIVWNGYKDKLWTKYKPEGRLAFEFCRMVSRDPDLPPLLKLVADLIAGYTVVDGLNAAAEGLKKEREAQRPKLLAPAPRLLPGWQF